MIGESVPSGKLAEDRADLVVDFLRGHVAVLLEHELDHDLDMPSLVVDRSSSMPETVLMISSIGLVTLVSISSTLAPWSVVVTVTTGRSTLGNRSTPSRRCEASPSTTGAETNITVKIGRLMQMSQIVMGNRLG